MVGVYSENRVPKLAVRTQNGEIHTPHHLNENSPSWSTPYLAADTLVSLEVGKFFHLTVEKRTALCIATKCIVPKGQVANARRFEQERGQCLLEILSARGRGWFTAEIESRVQSG